MALEHHSLDVPWWNSMVTVQGGGSLFDKGFAVPPNAPGLGLDVNVEVVKQHLRPNSGLFLPTPEWDSVPSNDRLWS
jgi:L-alanine-DL-glutamate epimerase-like enolase superfamily enzyme